MQNRKEPRLVFGEGRISGALSVLLGASSCIAVLCFHFPEYLTTPELRRVYPIEILRGTLLAGMLAAALLGGMSIWLSRSPRLGFLGMALALLAEWMGGAHVELDSFEEPLVSFGFDWLVIALLANSAIFIFIERAWPHRPEQLTFRPEWRLDLVYYAFNHVMVGTVLLVTTAFSEGLFGWAVHDGLQLAVRQQPLPMQLLEVLIVADLFQYAGHRAMHELPTLWKFHAVHHCPVAMDWLAGSRMHFLEVLFVRSTVLLPIFLLGFDEAAINGYVIWVGIQSVLIHANTGITFGPLEGWLASPRFHHWHHAADAEAIDRNYAAHLPAIDRVFGTFLDSGSRWIKTLWIPTQIT